MGDSLNGEGSHNIIEPLSVGKSVVVGPSIWGIEFPAIEALEAGALTKVESPEGLFDLWASGPLDRNDSALREFVSLNGGAAGKAAAHLQAAGFLSDTPGNSAQTSGAD